MNWKHFFPIQNNTINSKIESSHLIPIAKNGNTFRRMFQELLSFSFSLLNWFLLFSDKWIFLHLLKILGQYKARSKHQNSRHFQTQKVLSFFSSILESLLFLSVTPYLHTYIYTFCHSSFLFRVLWREGEEELFSKWNKLEYRKLLWHGSKVAVFVA